MASVVPPVIPQTDPGAAYRAHRDDIDAAVRRVLESGSYILGPEVAAFEAEFAAFCGVSQAVGVANGTDALTLALKAVGIRPGDAVATVSHTAVATVAAIELAGACPVLVDVDDAYGMDPASLDAALGDGDRDGGPIRAVTPVHLYGQPVALDAVLERARTHGLPVIEDASQAHGARWAGLPVGGFGAVGAFSLYPTKNLGAFGDGGVLTTNDPTLAERLRALRQYGWGGERYVSAAVGQNSRLDELQAAVLRVRLARLAADNDARRRIAALYDQALAVVPEDLLLLPRRRAGGEHVFHQYVVALGDAAPERDAVRAAMQADGVMTGVHYPVPVHLQPAYRGRLRLAPGGLPRTERIAPRILSLPMHPLLSDEAAARVCVSLRRALLQGAA